LSLITKIESIKDKISGRITFNENLSKFSWFNLGGPAKVLFRPENLNDLSFFLKEIKETNNIKVLGAGSNTLIRDGGFEGVVIKFGKSFSDLSSLDSETLVVGAAALDKNISSFALQKSISGFEFLSCIPGTIGGAIRMNSGCYGEEISKILVSVQIMDLNGKIKTIKSSEIDFYYRGCSLSENLIFISATLKGKKSDNISIKKKIDDLIERKKNSQPNKIKTCGSTFKNPNNDKAWKLIKNSGCSGMSVGDAQISNKHSNFFVNNGKAKSDDLENLIEKVKRKVFEKTNIKLELELKIIGKKL